jgi:hypothetical protein
VGFAGVDTPGRHGVEVRSVTPGTDATRLRRLNGSDALYYLVPGDVVVGVNGRPTPDLDSYFSALKSTEHGNVVLSVRDRQTHQVENWIIGKRPPASGRVRTVICGLTNAQDISASVADSVQQFKKVFEDNISPQHRTSPVFLTGDRCNAHSIVQSIRELTVGANDTLVFYYSGHGAFDLSHAPAGDLARGHFLAMANYASDHDDLMRATLLQELAKKRPRLLVVITESCNTYYPAHVNRFQLPSGRPAGQTSLEKLLLNYRGVVDLNSSSHGQVTWGGLFTRSLCDGLQSHDNWRELLTDVQQATNRSYHQFRTDMLQDPLVRSEKRTVLLDQADMFPEVFLNSHFSAAYNNAAAPAGLDNPARGAADGDLTQQEPSELGDAVPAAPPAPFPQSDPDYGSAPPAPGPLPQPIELPQPDPNDDPPPPSRSAPPVPPDVSRA